MVGLSEEWVRVVRVWKERLGIKLFAAPFLF